MPGADAHRRVSVERCKPCTNPHDRGDMPRVPSGWVDAVRAQQFYEKKKTYHVTQDDTSAPLQRLEVERITGMAINRSVEGVGSSR